MRWALLVFYLIAVATSRRSTTICIFDDGGGNATEKYCRNSMFCVFVMETRGRQLEIFRGCDEDFQHRYAEMNHLAIGGPMPGCIESLLNHHTTYASCNMDLPIWNPELLPEFRADHVRKTKEMQKNFEEDRVESVSVEIAFLLAGSMLISTILAGSQVRQCLRKLRPAESLGDDLHRNLIPSKYFYTQLQRQKAKSAVTGRMNLEGLAETLFSIEYPLKKRKSTALGYAKSKDKGTTTQRPATVKNSKRRSAGGSNSKSSRKSSKKAMRSLRSRKSYKSRRSVRSLKHSAELTVSRKKTKQLAALLPEVTGLTINFQVLTGAFAEEPNPLPIARDYVLFEFGDAVARILAHGPYMFPHSPLDLIHLLNKARDLFAADPVFMSLPGPLMIIGDLRGQYLDFHRWLDFIRFEGGRTRFLFLGNVVDQRHPGSIDCLALVCALKLKFPRCVYYLRGMNESSSLTLSRQRFNSNAERHLLEQGIRELFGQLPLVALVEGKILAVPSGICHLLGNKENLKSTLRPFGRRLGYEEDHPLAEKLATSLPDQDVGWYYPAPGRVEYYGQEALVRILRCYGAQMIVRSRNVLPSGFYSAFDGRLMNIWSATHQPGRTGAILAINEKATECTILQLKATLLQSDSQGADPSKQSARPASTR
ncbi:unnamed protein product, partial [Mesorhabditis spiculigera]